MTTRFQDYAYTEIVNRRDRGAGLVVRLHFHLNGHEVFGLSDLKIARSPSMHTLPSSPEFDVGYLLTVYELKSGAKIDAQVVAGEIEAIGVNHTDYAVKKDLYALFATLGYLCTKFDRGALVEIHTTDTEQRSPRLSKIYLTSGNFTDEPNNIKEKALGFYVAMITEAGEKMGFDEINDETLSRNFGITISVVPDAATLN